jgi:hypothetical protein
MNNLINIQKKFFYELGLEIYNEKENDITLYACPNCLEGNSYGKKHRCHWITKDNKSYIHCFNCDWALNFNDFLKKMGGETVYKEFIKNLKNKDIKESNSFQEKLEKKSLNKPNKIHWNFKKASTNKKIIEYLKKRKLENDIDKFYVSIYNELIIPMKYKINKRIYYYGFQSKNIIDKDFKIVISTENKKFRLWNLENLDFEKECYIFEGVEDALSSGLENICASFGKSLDEYLLKKMKYPVFCYDNDLDGKYSSLKQSIINKNTKVLIYPKNFKEKDMNELLQNGESKNNIKKFIKENLACGLKLEIYRKRFLVHFKKLIRIRLLKERKF